MVIPESAREIMRKPEKAFCSFGAEWITESRDNIGIGLAPGGIAKVWLGGACLKAVEIVRVVGTINTQGPSRPLSETSRTYIEQFGIPYGSW
ncbi:DUF2931 family protein [Pseudomonas sp. LB3P81]